MISRVEAYFEQHPEVLAGYAPSEITQGILAGPGRAIIAVCQSSLNEPWRLGGSRYKTDSLKLGQVDYQFTFIHPDQDSTHEIPRLHDFLDSLIPLCRLSMVIPKELNLWEAPFPIPESLDNVLGIVGYHADQSTFRFDSYRSPNQKNCYNLGRLVFETVVTKL